MPCTQIWRRLQKPVFQLVSNTPVTTVIDLLRHGDVEGGRRYRGHQDDPLSELGWQQLRDNTKHKQDWHQIISSPLKRCAEFAGELANKHQLPLKIEQDFKEISFGLWEGKSAEELLVDDEIKIKKYWSDPVNVTPPQGEDLLSFEKKIILAWNKMLNQYAGQHILLLSHAGVMRIILCHILGMPLTELFKLDIALAKSSRIEVISEADEIYPRLMFHGNIFS